MTADMHKVGSVTLALPITMAAARKTPTNVVHLSVERGPHRGITQREIKRRAVEMIGALQLQNIELSIVLTDDKGIHKLNKVYRDKDRPTDVLAFAMREGDFGTLAGGVLGDVIVSVETARKQASERGVSVLEEVTMLCAHGLLHLLGWDHDTTLKDRRMRAETDRLCLAAAPKTPPDAVSVPSTARPQGFQQGRKRAPKRASKRALTQNLSRQIGKRRTRK
jgi:probable rRNA maturation factor